MKRLVIGFIFILLGIALVTLTSCHSTDSSPVSLQDSTKKNNYVIESKVTRRIVDNTNLIVKVYDDTVFQVSEGVRETDILYLNEQLKPVKVFILRVDLNNSQITLEGSVSYNGSTFDKETVLDMAEEADSVGHRVIAGINGDFFFATKPWGIVVKNGKVLKNTWETKYPSGHTFLAILTSSRSYIGYRSDFANIQDSIKDALGGTEMLVFNKQIQPGGDPSLQPRTGVGVTDSDVIYFIVADGRDPGYSIGLAEHQLAVMLKALGTIKAIKLDGGGSSTFLIRNNGKWDVRNKPSDGSLRAVSNAWLVISKNDSS